jgi:hypothetical protein
VWARQPDEFFEQATVDMDGHIVETGGECKQGIDISYDGRWSYHPLLFSLAETGEPLRIVNRSGNRPSHEGAAAECDAVAAMLRAAGFRNILFRGDTDYSQTKHLDRWDTGGIVFHFGYAAMPNLEKIADGLGDSKWKRLRRPPRYTVKTQARTKPERVKEQIIVERESGRTRIPTPIREMGRITVCLRFDEFRGQNRPESCATVLEAVSPMIEGRCS